MYDDVFSVGGLALLACLGLSLGVFFQMVYFVEE